MSLLIKSATAAIVVVTLSFGGNSSAAPLSASLALGDAITPTARTIQWGGGPYYGSYGSYGSYGGYGGYGGYGSYGYNNYDCGCPPGYGYNSSYSGYAPGYYGGYGYAPYYRPYGYAPRVYRGYWGY